MGIKVFRIGKFYNEATNSYSDEEEITDNELEYVIVDRGGRVGLVAEGIHETFVTWIDSEDIQYRVQQLASKGDD